MLDGKALGEQLSAVVKEYVTRAVQAFDQKLADSEIKTCELLKDIPAGPQGERGEKGERGDSVAGPAGERGEKGESGKSIVGPQGERGEKGESGESVKGEPGRDGQSVALEEVLEALQPKMVVAVKNVVADLYVPKDGETGEKGEKGEPGVEGRSVLLAEILPEVIPALQKELRAVVPELREEMHDAVATLPKAKDGRDGKDGTSVTVDDIRPIFEKELAKWELEFERRSSDLIQRCIDRIEKPKDGVPGKDGRDALGFDDLDVVYDGGRNITLRFMRGELVKEFILKIPVVLEQGVYREGQSYEKGDGVTWGGSYWLAKKDTAAKPGDSEDWRLSVKKGRDGKQGEPGKDYSPPKPVPLRQNSA